MSRIDAAVIIIICAIIGFILGMAIPGETSEITRGFNGAIMGAGAGAILCLIIIRFSKR